MKSDEDLEKQQAKDLAEIERQRKIDLTQPKQSRPANDNTPQRQTLLERLKTEAEQRQKQQQENTPDRERE